MLSNSRRTESVRKVVEDDVVQQSSFGSSQLPVINRIDARLRQIEGKTSEGLSSTFNEDDANISMQGSQIGNGSDDEEVLGTRGLTQREKDLLQVSRQRRHMAKESQRMEREYLKDLRNNKMK